MPSDSLNDIRDRVRSAWTSRRVCGLAGIAATLRVERIIALDGAGRLGRDEALRMARETEALALCFPPLAWR